MSTLQPLETTVTTSSVTVYVAFELGKWAWLVGIFAPELGKAISRHKIAGGDWKTVMDLLAAARARVEQPQRNVRIVSIYEAGYEGAWLHRALLAAGIESRVIDAASMAVDRRARRVKTDRLDLERLMRELLALERGERSGVSRVVRVPSAEEEDAREQHRQRDFLVRQRTALVNRMSGLLMARGVRGLSPRRLDFLPKMQAAVGGDGQPLLPGLQRALTLDYQRLQLIEQQIATIEAEQAKELKAVRGLTPRGAAEASAVNAARLAELKGIGPIGGLVLSREVFYRHFDNRRQLASYFGFTPSPYYSGGSRTDQGISRAGNARARAIAVELAWFWAASSAGKRAQLLVSRLCRPPPRSRAADRDHRPRAQADDRIVAISDDRAGARRGGNEGGVVCELDGTSAVYRGSAVGGMTVTAGPYG